MIAYPSRSRRSLVTAASYGSALTAALALIGLVVITGAPGSPRLALRADSYNQMTGIGSTASAVTVNWTSGLLNAENQPITGSSSTDGAPELSPNSDRGAASPTSPLSFMYSDFKNISVTVSQTQDIGHQGITVSWSGAKAPTAPLPYDNFMQMMECYGDSDSGPSPEGCMFGSSGTLGTTLLNGAITDRGGFLCSLTPGSTVPSTNPADAPTGHTNGDPSQACDPYEPAAETVPHCDTLDGPNFDCANAWHFYVPFVPASGGNPLYLQTHLTQQFNQFDSNEVAYAPTSSDGTGQIQFQTLTSVQAPSLGCGALESNGQTRNCWLVIVPRGTFEPNGFQVPNLDFNYQAGQFIDSSPLSASNWAQRIQIHLGYAPLATNCPISVVPDAMVGTQVAYRAVTSWQGELNQQANCTKVYSYTATTESSATNQLTGGSAGLAFTTIPIGSEAARDGLSPPTLPTILYAPVAVTALDVGYNINQTTGQLTTPVKLTPALLARSLTQVYRYDLPDYVPARGLFGPAWSASNPSNLTYDPEFQALNPEIGLFGGVWSSAPFITGDHSADNQRVWEYIQSDPATATWLDGGAADSSDPVGADPNYTALNLGASPAPDSFPVAYTGAVTCAQVAVGATCGTTPDAKLNSVDMIPVQNNFDQAASTVVSGKDSALQTLWNSGALSPQGTQGWWTAVGAELPGHVFLSALNDMSDLAAYGLNFAALCPAGATSPTDTNCVQPSLDSVAAALNSTGATTDSAGLIQVNPAKVPAGSYPLVDVVYAAVPTNQSAAALNDYADFIAYAAGQGQTTGSAPGDLPAGYLPLTSSLQTQAQGIVAQLRTLAGGTSSPTASPTTSATGTASATTTGGTTTGGTTTGGTTTGGTTTGTTTTGGTTTGGTTTGGTTTGGTTGGSTTASAHATQSAATSTCAPAATPAASASGTASTTPAAAAAAGTACATPQAFDVLPPSAEAAAGTTPDTTVGSVRGVLIIVLIIGAAGGVGGTLLRYGRAPGRGRRSRAGADGS
jgi:hypothetical protein